MNNKKGKIKNRSNSLHYSEDIISKSLKNVNKQNIEGSLSEDLEGFQKQKFFVFGLHCKACELLIQEVLSDEKEILKFKLDKTSKHQTYILEVIFEDKKFGNKDKALAFIKDLFKNNSYKFSYELEEKNEFNWLYFLLGLLIAIVILEIFWLLNKFGVINQVGVDANSSFFTFFVFGFLASISSCAVLVGGIILSLTKFWQNSGISKWRAVFGFQIGRIVSFGFFGFLLGLIGEVFTINPTVNALLLLLVSILMILAGLNFLGFSVLGWLPTNKWAILKPKSTRFFPILAGAITFFLPCGFTYTTQALALSSGNSLKAFFIMLFFVLGTLPILTIIGLTGFKSSSNTKKVGQKILNYVIGMLIIIFGFISLNSQFTILGFPSFNFNSNTTETIQEQNIENNVIQMIYSKAGLIPSVINLEAGKDYKIIIDVQTTVYGCMSTIFLEKLNTQMRVLNAGTKLEFDIKSPQKGSYDFLCAMGVPHNSKVVVE